MKKLLVILSLLPMFCFANHCQELDMAIANNTGHVCKLIKADLIHGKLSQNTHFAQFIPNNSESDSVIIKQAALDGPKVVLHYDCGDKSISIASSQTICVMVEGTVNAHIIEADNMGAQANTQKGSFIWSKHGEVRWRLH